MNSDALAAIWKNGPIYMSMIAMAWILEQSNSKQDFQILIALILFYWARTPILTFLARKVKLDEIKARIKEENYHALHSIAKAPNKLFLPGYPIILITDLTFMSLVLIRLLEHWDLYIARAFVAIWLLLYFRKLARMVWDWI